MSEQLRSGDTYRQTYIHTHTRVHTHTHTHTQTHTHTPQQCCDTVKCLMISAPVERAGEETCDVSIYLSSHLFPHLSICIYLSPPRSDTHTPFTLQLNYQFDAHMHTLSAAATAAHLSWVTLRSAPAPAPHTRPALAAARASFPRSLRAAARPARRRALPSAGV